MRRKNRINIQSIFLILLICVIGYAVLRTQLGLIGTNNVNKTVWDIHFENVQVTENSVTATQTPTTDESTTTEMTYAVTLTQPGDFYEFAVDIVNDGTMDVMISDLSNSVYASDGTTEISLPTYLRSTLTDTDGATVMLDEILPKKTRRTVVVRIEFRRDINPEDLPTDGNKRMVFKLKVDYIQARNAQKAYPCPGEECVYSLGNGVSPYNPAYPEEYHELENYTKNYRELKSRVFQGHVLDEKNRVVRNFICGIHDNGNVFCIENNKNDLTILNSKKFWNGKCPYIERKRKTVCDGDVSVEKDSNYNLHIYDNINDHDCYMYQSSTLAC